MNSGYFSNVQSVAPTATPSLPHYLPNRPHSRLLSIDDPMYAGRLHPTVHDTRAVA
jgi:hypothetical protein